MRSSAVPPTLLRSPSRRCDSVVITFATGAVPGFASDCVGFQGEAQSRASCGRRGAVRLVDEGRSTQWRCGPRRSPREQRWTARSNTSGKPFVSRQRMSSVL